MSRRSNRWTDKKLYCDKCNDRNWLMECGCGCGGIMTRIKVYPTGHYRVNKYISSGHSMKGKRNPKRSQYLTGRRGSETPSWKGGKSRAADGRYEFTYKPEHYFANKEGYVMTHRIVYEESRNCCLLPWTDVHHIDGNTMNNVWSNLMGLMHGQHTTITNQQFKAVDMTGRRCSVCGTDKTWIRKTGRPLWNTINGEIVCTKCYYIKYYKRKKTRCI